MQRKQPLLLPAAPPPPLPCEGSSHPHFLLPAQGPCSSLSSHSLLQPVSLSPLFLFPPPSPISALIPSQHPPPRLPLLLKKTFPGPSWLWLNDVGSCPCRNKDLAFQLSESNLQCQLSLMCAREIRGGRAARNIKTMIRIPLKC